MSTSKREIEKQIERNYQVVIEDTFSYTTTLGDFTLQEAKEVLALREQTLTTSQDAYIYDTVNKEIVEFEDEEGDNE